MNAHALHFLQDLAIVLLVAGAVAVIFRRFRLPVVLGFILAGVIVGPHTPPYSFVNSEENIRTLADLGVILLLFYLGLEFRLGKLKELGATASIAALFEIVLMIGAGYVLGRAFGWNEMDSIFLGAMLSISSTTIIVKTLNDLGLKKERFAQIQFGVLVVEDILAIVMLALLSGLAQEGALQGGAALVTIGKLAIFFAVVLAFGLLALPRLLSYVARYRSDEILLVTSLGICFGVSLLAVQLGYSPALGAFLAGAIIAETREAGRIEVIVEPVRDMFGAIFFVAIGLLIDPRLIVEHLGPILLITVLVVVGKIVSCSLGAFLAGETSRNSLRAGLGLAQIGEFSFIIASLGIAFGVTSNFLYPIAVAVSAITTLLTPWLIQHSDGIAQAIERGTPQRWRSALGLYHQWIGNVAKRRPRSSIRKNLRKLIFQLGFTCLLIAGVFGSAAYFARLDPDWIPSLPESLGGRKALLWLAAMLACAPLDIAVILKLRNIGTLLSKMSVSHAAGGTDTAGIRAVIGNVILLGGIAGLGLLILFLSAAILPPFEIMAVFLLLVASFMILLWNRFAGLYSRARHSLETTLSQSAKASAHDLTTATAPATTGGALVALPAAGDFAIETFELHPNCSAVGKLLRHLAIRSSTGASVVGILREKDRIFNPGPDEELLAGDKILLIGTPMQIQKARKIMEPN